MRVPLNRTFASYNCGAQIPSKLWVRAVLILLTLLVLGLAEEARAGKTGSQMPDMRLDPYTIEVCAQKLGVADVVIIETDVIFFTAVYLGPLGNHRVPFTARQCLFGFPIILVMLIVIPTVLAWRLKRKHE